MARLEDFKTALTSAWEALTPRSDGSSAVYARTDSRDEEWLEGGHRQFRFVNSGRAEQISTTSQVRLWRDLMVEVCIHQRPEGIERTQDAFTTACEDEALDLVAEFETISWPSRVCPVPAEGGEFFDITENLPPRRPPQSGGTSHAGAARITFHFDVEISSVDFVTDLSIDVDGISDYLTGAHQSWWEGRTAFTAMMIHKPDVVTGEHSLITKWDQGADTSVLWETRTDEARCFIADAPAANGGPLEDTTDMNATAGVWRVDFIVYDGSQPTPADRLRFFGGPVSGGLVEFSTTSTGTIPAALTAAAPPLQIFRTGGLERRYAGRSNGAAVWGVPLSLGEMQAIFNDIKTGDGGNLSAVGSPAALRHWWRFQGTYNDAGPGALHLTAVGAPTFVTDSP